MSRLIINKCICACFAFIVYWSNSESVAAEQMMLVSGAGYKSVMTDIAAQCKQDYGLDMQISFGNFGQMLAQIKNTGMVQAVVSSDNFFTDYDVQISDQYPIGQGTLVLAWRKGLHLNQPEDISKPDIRRLVIPHVEKALYGRAGLSFLQSIHLDQVVKDKLYVVSTVPQVTSYLVAGEADAGFANLTDILKVKDKIGGYIAIQSGYRPIHIVSGVLPGKVSKHVHMLFRQCMTSEKVRNIEHQHGL